jgi:hypothetical protein
MYRRDSAEIIAGRDRSGAVIAIGSRLIWAGVAQVKGRESVSV